MQPNFFIVGAPKSATTNLSYYLKQHPQVFMPEELEPYYFARLDIPKDFTREIIKDKKKYLELFSKSGKKMAIGESSPVYLYCPHSASDIKEHFPKSKIIILLRNPIEISQSQYFSQVFNKIENRNFDDVLKSSKKLITNQEFHINNILEAGFYSKHLMRFKRIFPKDQIKIIVFEEYIKNTIPTVNSVLDFLGINEKIDFTESAKGAYRIPKNLISKKLLDSTAFRKISKLLIPAVSRQKIGEKYFVEETKKPPMTTSDREYLKKIFESDVKNLQEIIGRNLPWDDFN